MQDAPRPRRASRRSRLPQRRSAAPRPGPTPGDPSSRPGFTSASRIGGSVLLGLCAAGLVLYQYRLRHLEADLAAVVCRVIGPTLPASRAPIVWFGLGTGKAFGLVITPECSSALLISPLLAAGMALLIPRRLAVRRVLPGLGAACAVLAAGNVLRIGAIALTMRLDGLSTGYQLGHLVIGSLVSIVFIAFSLALLIGIVTARVRVPGRPGLPRPARRKPQ